MSLPPQRHVLARGACDGGLNSLALPVLHRHWYQRFISGFLAAQIFLSGMFNPQLSHGAPVFAALTESYAYDANGNIISRTDANGSTTSITYDSLNRITAVDYPSGSAPDIALVYDVNGNLTRMTDATGTTIYEYDLFDRMVEIARPDGGFVIYDYDNVGNVIGLHYGNYLALQANGTQTYMQYSYDADNRMISAKNAGTGHTTNYGYDTAGNIVRRTLPNGVYTDYGYDADGRLVSTVHRKADATLICGYQNTLNAIGNSTQVVESTPEGTKTTSYTYDAVNRLDTVSYPTGRVVDYDYDTWGNRIRMAETLGGNTNIRQYTYDTDARLLATTWNGDAEESFCYDRNGNLVQRHRIADNRVTSFNYDAEDRLIRHYDGVNNVVYEYNGAGERVAKVVNGVRTHFVSDSNRPHTEVLAETTAAGTPTRVYEWGNELINQEDATGGSRHYHLQDGPLGNVRRVVDSSATVVNSYEFDAFGNPIIKVEGVANDYQFQGEMQEEETGLLFLRARFTDPGTGRFLSRDPKAGSLRMPDTLNRYVFVLNNPVNLTDPAGTFPMPPAYPEARRFSVPIAQGPSMSRYDHVDHRAGGAWDPEVSASARYRHVGPRLSYSWDGLKFSLTGKYGKAEVSTSDGFSFWDFKAVSKDGYSGFTWTPTIELGLKNKALDAAGVELGIEGSAGYFSYMQKRTWHSVLDGANVNGSLVEEVLGREGLSAGDILGTSAEPPGGVALDKSANVLLDINQISGAAYDQEKGQIILYGKQDDSATALPKMSLDDLAVAFKAAAMGNMPELSIEDPIVNNVPEWPGRECFTVRYGPFYTDPLDGQKKVLDLTSKTRFGWVMFEADRLMKVLLMGKDNRYPEIPVSSNVPGYMNGTELIRLYSPDLEASVDSRFWLNPKEIIIAPSADGQAMELSRATMQVSTETMYASNGQTESLPDAEYFANWFTQNYDAIAEEQVTLDPEGTPRRSLKELKQLASVVSIVKWVKDNEIPMDLSFLRDHTPAHYEGAPSYTPLTSVVETSPVVGQKKTMTITGGVDYCADLDLLSSGNAMALAAGALSARRGENQLAWTFAQGGANYNASAFSVDRTPKDGGRGEVAVDASFALPGGQPLLLCRHFDSFNVAPSMFGWGWQAQPYALEFKGERSGLNYCHQTQGAYSEVLFTDRARRSAHTYVQSGTYDRTMDILGIAARFDPNETILAYSQNGKATPGLLFSDNKTRLTMRLQNGTLLDFDLNGYLTGITDPNGNTIVYGYDGNQRLTTIGRSGGRTITFGYDPQGRATTAALPDSRTITYAYDASGNLASALVGAPSGVLKRYAYESDHQLRAVQDENGEAALSYAYDVYGRMTGAQQPGVATPLTRTYNLTTKTTQTTGPEGFSSLVEFNDQHDPLRVTDARSNPTELTYNSRRDLVRVESPDGSITRHYYDGLGFHSATVALNGRADCTLNDSTGRPIGFFHSPADAAFTGSFDAEQIQTGNDMLSYLVDLTRFGRDAKGNLTAVTDANGNTSRLAYDTVGNLSSATDASGNRTDLTSDANARLTRVRNAAGHQVEFNYDTHDNLTRTTTAAGTVDYTYDGKDRLTTITMGDPGARRTTAYAYDDAKNQLKTVTDAAGTETKYAYDPRGNLVEVKHDGIVRFTHEYDGLNRLIQTRSYGTFGGARAAIVPLTPKGAQNLGGAIAITWQTSGDWGAGAEVTLQYSTDGTTWIDIATVPQALGSYLWNPGSLDSATVRVRLIRTDDPGFQPAATPLFAVKPAGSLRVNIAPATAVTAGARWRVDAGPWLASGAQVDALPAGAHRIDIKAPPDWDAAASQTVTVVANETTQASATLTQALATLTLESTGSGVVRVNGQAVAPPYIHDFVRGDSVTLTADSQVYWTGDLTGAASPSALVMDGCKSVTANFGTITEAGDLVWHDVNGNGLQDAGEPGLADVTINLYRTVDGVAGNADDSLEATQITDTAGHFSFKGLAAGRKYFMAFTAPPGYKPTLKNQGSNTGLDSDVDPATGRSLIFSLAAGEAAMTWDAGMAAGNRYYVNDGATANDAYCTSAGGDSNDGRGPSTPKATLKAILDTYDLNGGDVVYIDTGVYNVSTPTQVSSTDQGNPASSVCLIGPPTPGGALIKSLGSSNAISLYGSYMLVKDLSIKGGLYLYSTSACTVSNCRIYGAAYAGFFAQSGGLVVLDNNIIDNNGGAGIALNSVTSAKLKSNTVCANQGNQISFESSSNVSMSNNNFWASRTGSYAAYIYPSFGAVIASDYNNLYFSPGAYLSADSSLTFTLWKLITGHDFHSLSTNPLFVDADGTDNIAGNEDDDFHLMSTGGSWHGGAFAADASDSPLLDAGNPADSVGAEPAHHGARINIGAHGGTAEASKSPAGQMLTLFQPLGGNVWLWFQSFTWVAAGQGWQEGDTLRVEYSRNGGVSWTTATGAESLPYLSGLHFLDLTNLPPGSNYLFRLTSNRSPAVNAAIQGTVTVHHTGAIYYVNDLSAANDVYCTALGNNANDGHSPSSPKASVQALLDSCNLEFGDQVLIDSGTYALTSNIVVGADDGGSIFGYVTLKGVPGRTIIDRQSTSTGAAGILVRSDYVRAEGLTVRNGRYGIAVDTDLAKYAVVQGNVVMNNLTAGVDVRSWANSSVDGKRYVIANNLAVNNGTGLFLQGGWNPSFSTGEFQVVNNTVAGTGNGIHAASSEDGKGYVTLTNNIVSISGAGRYAIGDAADSVAASDYNLFWVSGGAIVAQRTESLYSKNYATLASWQARTGKDIHSLNTDPLFANAAAGDYHPRSKGGRYDAGSGAWVVDADTSWAIDTGDPAAATGSEPAPHGSRVNMGAYGGTAEASKTPPGRSLRVLGPNAGEAVAGGVRLQWNSLGTGWQTGDDTVKLEYSNDAGVTWRAVEGAGSVQHWSGQAKWATAGLTPNYGSAFLWRLTSNADAQVTDVCDRIFTLHNQPLAYYVNDTVTAGDMFCYASGADANNGTSPATPKATVQALLDFYDLEPGDTVYIDSGTYLLTSNIEVSAADGGSSAGYMSFKGVPGSTVIDRQSTATDAMGFRIAGNYVNMEGLTLRNGRDGIGFEDYSTSHIRIANNVLRNNLGAGVNARIFSFGAGRKFVISNNIAVDNGTGILVRDPMQASDISAEVLILNNTVVGAGWGIYADSHNAGAGIVTVLNNIVTVSGTNNIALAESGYSLLLSDYNNLVASGGAFVAQRGVKYSTLQAWQEGEGRDGHSLSRDPLFANAATGDYHLMSAAGRYDAASGTWVMDGQTSWCIDAGHPLNSSAGEPQPNGGRINLGIHGGGPEASKSAFGRRIALLNPNGGETWRGQRTLRWQTTGLGWQSTDTVSVYYSSDGGANWVFVAGGIAASAGELPLNLSTFAPGVQSLFKVVTDQDAEVADSSNGEFTLSTGGIYYVNDAYDAQQDKYCLAAGSAANDGLTPSTPKANLQALLDAVDLGPGDLVLVDAGTYNLTSYVLISSADGGSAGGRVKIAGVKGKTFFVRGTVIPNSDPNSCLLIAAPYVTVENLNCSFALYGARFYDSADYSTVRGCIFDQCWVGMQFDSGADYCTAEGNTITACATSGIEVEGASWALIEHNIIRHAGSIGAVVVQSYFDEIYSSLNCTIRNNTILASKTSGVLLRTGPGLVLTNNIVQATGPQGVCLNLGYLNSLSVSNYNLLKNDKDAVLGATFEGEKFQVQDLSDWQERSRLDADSIAAAPSFANPAVGDYHLKSVYGRYDPANGKPPSDPAAWVQDTESSVAIDAGAPGDQAGSEPMPNGGRINVGAYGGTEEASRSSSAARVLTLVSPDGGQFLGSPVGIKWNRVGAGWHSADSLFLEYSADRGATWLPIAGAASVPVPWSQFWWDTVGLPNGLSYMVRATCVQDATVRDVCNGWFALAKPGDGHWELFVAPHGVDDAYHGSALQPLRTINAALEIARGGLPTSMVNIRVAAGAYAERVSMRPYVNLLGGYSATDWSRDIGANVTTLNGAGGSVVTGADNAVLEGFTITGGSATNGAGIYCNASAPTIRSCRIVSNTATYGGGVYVTGASPQLISCIIAGNEATYGDGLYLLSGSPIVTNCTLANNGGYGVSANASGTCVVANSILWNNGDDVFASAGAAVTTSYCDIEDNDGGTINLHLNPLLDATFRLMAGSPCRGAGNGAVLQPNWLDVDGKPRVHGAVVDIGAFEQGGTVVRLQITDAFAGEMDGDQAVFLLTRDGDTSTELTVYLTTAGSAVNGTDYTGIPEEGVVSFAAGVATMQLLVIPIADALVEGTETVNLTLSANPAYMVAGAGTGTVNLLDTPQPPEITSSTTLGATIGQFLNYQITAFNAPTSYGAENLPAGLEVNNSTGVISGTPTVLGTTSVTIRASNVAGVGQATLTLTVYPGLTINPLVLPGGTAGTNYNHVITVSGGTKPYTTFALTNFNGGGTGLANFHITTNPTAGTFTINGSVFVSGTATFTTTVMDKAGAALSQNYSVVVTAPAAPVVTSAGSATGMHSKPFSYQITAANNPTSFGATGLPSGLSVNSATGLISGTPTVAGLFNVTLRATNAIGNGTAPLALTVQPPTPEISVEQPAGTPLTSDVGTVNYVEVPLVGRGGKIFIIKNTGGSALNIAGMTIEGGQGADFTIASPLPGALAAGASANVLIHFRPGGMGVRTAALHVASDSPSGLFTVALSGTGVENAGPLLATYLSGTDVPVTAESFTATGMTVGFALNYAPVTGTTLMVVNNTGLDFIKGTFTDLAQGQEVALDFGGQTYRFVANYFGGTGNDLVLNWAATRPLAWGWGEYGQLGNNATASSSLPVAVRNTGVLAGKSIVQMAGSFHSVALCADGTVAVWGSGTGTGSSQSSVPLAVDQTGVLVGRTVVAISAGSGHTLALCSDGTLAAWGFNGQGQLGTGSLDSVYTPVEVVMAGALAGRSPVAIVAGGLHSVALCSDGTVVTWGYNSHGQLGKGDTISSTTPVAVRTTGALAGKVVVSVSAGEGHTLAVCSDGTVAAWGWNAYGQIGNANSVDVSVPMAVVRSGVLAGKAVLAVSSGYHHSLARCSDGTVVSWGLNSSGNLGNSSFATSSSVPVAVTTTGILAGKTVISVAAGNTHSFGLCSDGTLAAWGRNHYGQLGDGSTESRRAPVPVNTTALFPGERFAVIGGGPLAEQSLAAVAMPITASPEIAVELSPGIVVTDNEDSLDLGAVLAGASTGRTFTVKNVGSANLTGLAIAKDGTHEADFTVTPLSETALMPGESAVFDVQFTPGAGGERTVFLHISSNDEDESSFDIAVTAVGIMPPFIATAPASVLAGVGEPATFTVAATGGALSYQWLKNGAVINGAKSISYTIPAVSLTSAGNYSVRVSNSKGTVTSLAGKLGVVILAGTPVTFNEGTALKLSVLTAVPTGTTMTYEWRKDGTTLVDGGVSPAQVISGSGKATLNISKVDATKGGSYTCVAGMVGLTRETGSFNVTIRLRPVINPLGPLAWRVSSLVTEQVTAQNSPVSFAFSNLPPGVTGSTTGQLAGKPNAATTAAPKPITVTASNLAGRSAPFAIAYTVASLPAKATGTFNGLVDRSTALSSPLANPPDQKLQGHGGSLENLVVTATGAFTGVLKLEDKSYTMPAGSRLDVDEFGDSTATVRIVRGMKPDTLADLTLSFAINKDTGELTGTLTDDIVATPVAVRALRNAWKTTNTASSPANPASTLAGAYTAMLDFADPSLRGNANYPQGHGFGTLTVTAAGLASWTGVLGDGTPVTLSTTMGPNGEVPLHFLLYTPKVAATAGSAHGWVQLSPGTDAIKLYDNLLDTMLDFTQPELKDQPMFDWMKKPQLVSSSTRSYKSGIPLHKLKVIGGGYLKPASGVIVLGLPDQADNAQLSFSEANIETSVTYLNAGQGGPSASLDKKRIRITKTNTLASFAAGTNPAGITLSLNTATGALSGSYKLMGDLNPTDHSAPFATVDRKVNFTGVLVPRLNLGIGSFQLPQLPSDGPPLTTQSTSPVMSGKMLLEPSQ